MYDTGPGIPLPGVLLTINDTFGIGVFSLISLI